MTRARRNRDRAYATRASAIRCPGKSPYPAPEGIFTSAAPRRTPLRGASLFVKTPYEKGQTVQLFHTIAACCSGDPDAAAQGQATPSKLSTRPAKGEATKRPRQPLTPGQPAKPAKDECQSQSKARQAEARRNRATMTKLKPRPAERKRSEAKATPRRKPDEAKQSEGEEKQADAKKKQRRCQSHEGRRQADAPKAPSNRNTARAGGQATPATRQPRPRLRK